MDRQRDRETSETGTDPASVTARKRVVAFVESHVDSYERGTGVKCRGVAFSIPVLLRRPTLATLGRPLVDIRR